MLTVLLALLLVVCLMAAARYAQLVLRHGRAPQVDRKRHQPCRTLVVLGSGGHTAEMLQLMSGLTVISNYAPRVYVVARGDQMSIEKVKRFESSVGAEEVDIRAIPRARQVQQSYISSVLTTALAGLYSLPLVVSAWPELVVVNGPGTCIPLCLSAYLMRFLGVRDVRVVYVESFCRVDTLSLSGRLLYASRVADHLLVQWPQLASKYPRAHYIGRLV